MHDTHVHSTFSADGKSALSEYAALMDAGKLKTAGFAEHLDFLPECGSYRFLDHPAYVSAINEYRQRGYEFYAGAEIDYAKRIEPEILETLKRDRYDYTICSIHMINGFSVSDGRNTEYFYDKNDSDYINNIIESYYAQADASVKAGIFDVIGHIGIYKRPLPGGFFDGSALGNRIAEMENELARECALSGKIVEVNSSGLFYPWGGTFPDETFLKAYLHYGGSMVSVGSDAHRAADAGRGFDVVYDMLKAIGFNYVYLPWDKERPVKI